MELRFWDLFFSEHLSGGLQAAPMNSTDDYDPEFDDFEAWQIPARLLENEDYPGYVDYCERAVAHNSDDLHAQDRLGVAYIYNKQYEKAIDVMGAIHRKRPDLEGFKYSILDALFALGKTEDDFDWAQPPIILRIDQDLLDDIHEYLRPKLKPRTVEELRLGLMSEGYMAFSAEEFLQALEKDSRFIIQPHQIANFARVRVRRKKDGPAKQVRGLIL